MKIGFIGLGIMGKPMAKNLIDAGHELVVLDNNRPNEKELVEAGAIGAVENGKAVAEQVDLVITMLPNSPHVKSAVLGEGGVREGAHEGLVLIDMSSISPIASREVHDALAEHGVQMLDAPVSGGEPKAVDGTLSIMVGGDKELFDQYAEVLGALGSAVTYVGPIGAGNIAKLANQAVVAVNIAVVGEALVLAQKAGVDPESVFAAIRGGLAGSTVMDAKAPMMLAHEFDPGFRINLHIKDLDNALAAGHEYGSPLPLTAQVREMMTALAVGGGEAEDHSSLVKFYEKLANTSLGETEPEATER